MTLGGFTLSGVAAEVAQELQQKSRKAIYKRDPEAWFADVLNGRWWSKQKEIVWSFADPEKALTMTVVKSCNGVGKTRLAGDLATYLVSVFDPMETSIITTAPIFSQIRTGLFRYIADNYSTAAANGLILPGRFISDPALKVPRLDGGLDKDVIQAKRPADNNLISSFQGIHDGLVAVLMDEAGGLPEDLWIGANAVTTNEHAKILAIGNPDRLSTAFHNRFRDREKYKDWNPISISAYESPNLTGEIIHPDPEKDKEIKSHLVQKDWVEMMERQAHPNVVLAKVHGEFPKGDDNAFFTQHAMDTAYNTEINPPEGARRIMGVDIAFGGEDSTVAYLNVGGHIRKVKELPYDDDYFGHAQAIQNLAIAQGVDELRVDAAGSGKGIHSILDNQLQTEQYDLIGLSAGTASPDNTKWAQLRAYLYDSFRKQMQSGEIDLDHEDRKVREQMEAQPYDINPKGAIQIMPKKTMRDKGLLSPDELDAAIFAGADLTPWTGNQWNQYEPGTAVVQDYEDMLQFMDELPMSGPGLPLL